MNKTVFYILSGFWGLLLLISLLGHAIPLLPVNVEGIYALPPGIAKVFAAIMTILLAALLSLYIYGIVKNRRRLVLCLFIVSFLVVGLAPTVASKLIAG